MKKKNSNIKATGVLLVLILMLMVGLLYINNINSKREEGSRDIKSLVVLGQLEAQDKNSSVCSIDELMAEASGAVVKARNINGNIVWSKTMAGKVANMKSTSGKLYVLDNSKRLHCISKEGKLLWDKQLEGEIKNIYTEKSGDVLIEYTYNNGSKVQIINAKGLAEGEMVLESAQVISFASGNKENTLSILDISSNIIKTKLITLNLSGEMIWSDNLDNMLIPVLGYAKDNTLIAVGEKIIFKYKDQSKKQSKLDLNKTIYNASISIDGVAVVVRGKRGYEAISYDSSLKELGKLELEQAPTGIILENNNYILYYGEKLLLSDLKGSIKAEYKSIPEINKAYFGSEGSIISVSDRLIQKLGYK